MPTLLDTDGYKFSMQEAGFPLRRETFYYSHRRGGWQYNPVDIPAFIRALLPTVRPEDYAFLDGHNYFLGGAFRDAIRRVDEVRVNAIPKGAWFYDREPVFTVTGPSALVSWLEPLALQLNRRIQIATRALLDPASLPELCGNATCEEEATITRETLGTVGVTCAFPITIEANRYQQDVDARVKRLVAIVENPDRIFEVGMRAVSCPAQHELALAVIRDAGVLRTSNVGAAARLGMVPVGTMGHEHIMRHGTDYAAFVAMRDRVPGFISYLPDTFDTVASGLPSALRVLAEDKTRNSGIRFDSEHGIRGHYLYAVCRAREQGFVPYLMLESGWDDALTTEFERLRELVEWPAERQGYGIGGFLVKPGWAHLGRDTVSAVWKVTQSGDSARMKIGDEPGQGKASIPGRPVVWRPHLGMSGYGGPVGYVAQEGENWTPPVPATLLSGLDDPPPSVAFRVGEILGFAQRPRGIAYSPGTQSLVDAAYRLRKESIAAAMG